MLAGSKLGSFSIFFAGSTRLGGRILIRISQGYFSQLKWIVIFLVWCQRCLRFLAHKTWDDTVGCSYCMAELLEPRTSIS
ncbi:hypothetical protein LINPERHAP2_LOCUS7066 [Linum perenne]